MYLILCLSISLWFSYYIAIALFSLLCLSASLILFAKIVSTLRQQACVRTSVRTCFACIDINRFHHILYISFLNLKIHLFLFLFFSILILGKLLLNIQSKYDFAPKDGSGPFSGTPTTACDNVCRCLLEVANTVRSNQVREEKGRGVERKGRRGEEEGYVIGWQGKRRREIGK